MKEGLKKEIKKMIKAETECIAVTKGQYCTHVDHFSHTEVLHLILSHLKLELNIKCRHPRTTLEKMVKEK